MRIQPFTEDELEAIAKQYEEEVAAGVKYVMKHFTSSITAASFQTISLDDLSALASRWAKFAIEDLLASLITIFTHGAERLSNDMPPVPGHIGIGSPDAIYRNTMAEEFLTRAENRLVGIGNDLWEHARIEVSEAFKQGESIDEIAVRLHNAANLTEPRARTVARTEAIAASNAGTLLEMRSYELTATKEWVATNDSQTRPTHHAADGQAVDLDGKFDVGEAKLDYPGDPTGPAGEVINCRCTTVYEIDDEEVDALTASDFIETEHPRGPGGKFAKKPGGSIKKLVGKFAPTKAIYGKHSHGDVVAEASADRLVWNADDKKFIHQVKTSEGDWKTETKYSKTDAYKLVKQNNIGWGHSPEMTNDPHVQPDAPSSLEELMGDAPLKKITHKETAGPKKFAPTKAAYGKYEDSEVVAELFLPGSDIAVGRMIYDAKSNKFFSQQQNPDGEWVKISTFTKGDAYKSFKNPGYNWQFPSEKKTVKKSVDTSSYFNQNKSSLNFSESKVRPAINRSSQEMKAIQNETPPPWTETEKQALRIYSGPSYVDINGCLRGKKPCDDSTQRNVKNIRKAMRPLAKPVTVYRGASLSAFGVTYGGSIDKSYTGKVITDSAFLSTSVDPNGAFGHKPVHLNIFVPEGAPAAYIAGVSSIPGEKELLLDARTKIRVLSVKKVKGQFIDEYHVEAEVVV